MGKNYLPEKVKFIYIDKNTINLTNIKEKILEIIRETIDNPDKIPEKNILKIPIKIYPDEYDKFKKLIKHKGWNISEYINYILSDK